MTADAPTLDFWRVLELIGQQYPQYLQLLQQPGVFDVFMKAFQDPASWSPERIQSAIQNTPYFQNTPADQRAWAVQVATDPATAKLVLDNTNIMVRTQAGQLGIPPDSIDPLMVLQAAANHWDATRIKMELVARLNNQSPLGPGGIGDTMTQLDGLAADYGVPINHNDLAWWGENIQGGSVTQEGFRDYVTQQAIALYPALKPFLETGKTVAQYAAPYFSLAANELGINPGQIDLRNPAWMGLVVGTDKAGNQGVNSLQEALTKLRSDPQYGYDKGLPGKTQAATFANSILQEFGFQA